MIRLEQISIRNGAFAVQEVSLEVPDGGYGLIIGPSGSGKTTLLESVAGHLPVSRGVVLVRGRDVTRLAPEARGIGIVYQHYHLFPHLTVRSNIAYGLAGNGRLAAARHHHRVEEVAVMLGLTLLLDRRIDGLSGGERQRVALARALAPRPKVLLLDEPFTALDPATRDGLRRELQMLQRAEGVTTLQVTHDFTDALRLGDVVGVMHEGRLVQSGVPEEVFRYPNSAFVARFIGSGNVLAGTVTRVPGDAADPSARRFPARFQSGRLSLEVIAGQEGPTHAVIRPEDLLVSREPFPGYPRNRFGADVVSVERLGPVALVYLDAEGTALTASITTATAEALELDRRGPVAVALKTTAVHLV